MAKVYAKRVGSQIMWLEDNAQDAIQRWNAEREPYDLLVGLHSIPNMKRELSADDIVVEYDPHAEEFIPYRSKAWVLLDNQQRIISLTLYPVEGPLQRDFTCMWRHAAEECVRTGSPISRYDITS